MTLWGSGDRIPVLPADLIILAIFVVVALLSAADLVPAQQHGYALATKQRGQEIPLLAFAPAGDRGILRGTLHAQVRVIVVGPILVGLAVGSLIRPWVAGKNTLPSRHGSWFSKTETLQFGILVG